MNEKREENFTSMSVKKPTNILEKLQARLSHRFAILEEDIFHLIKEELVSLEITPEPFRTVKDVWDDIDLYCFDENLFNRCEEKIQTFLYDLLADCVRELGVDEVRTYLITQGWSNEVEEMDMEDLIYGVNELLDWEIEEITLDLLEHFGQYELSFLYRKEYPFQQLCKQIEKPVDLHFLNNALSSWLFARKEQIKKQIQEEYGEMLLDDSLKITAFSSEKLVQAFFGVVDEEHLAQIVKYVETELTNEIKTRFQAFLAIRQTSIWKVCESIIDQHVGIWLHEVKKEAKALYDEWEELCRLLENSCSKEMIIILDKMRHYPTFIKEVDKKRRTKEEYEAILSKIAYTYVQLLNEKYQCSIEWNPQKMNRWLSTWFTSMEEFERSFLHSKEFNRHLKAISKQIFDHPLSLSASSVHKKYVVHVGPTNSGKTYDSMQRLLQAKTGMYLAPSRLLALEKFEEMCSHGIACALITGEERKNVHGSTHISATVESVNVNEEFEVVVIDECQLLADETRGAAWVKAIIGAKAKEIHLVVAPHAVGLLQTLLTYHQFDFEVIEHKRTTPLIWEEKDFSFPNDLQKGDALIVFSKKNVLHVAASLVKRGYNVSVLYGSMPPETRRKQVRQFRKGLTDILIATDAIGMGMNLPIRRVIFMESKKFDGKAVRTLKAEEVQQIAGRAGRKGIYEEGFVCAMVNRKKIKKLLEAPVAPIEYSFLPISIESLKKFPYESFDLFKRAWSFYQNELKETPYRVREISEWERKMFVLEKALKKMKIELPLWKKLSFCFVPFSIEETKITDCWLTMIREYLTEGKVSLPPILTSVDAIDELENGYKQLMLFTSFAYSQSLSFNEEEVFELKEKISEKIFEVLSKHLIRYMKKCKICNQELPWDFPYPHCHHCHEYMYVEMSF
ncbi:hypothetical protein EA138_11720 [Anoxybacillus flavithermus]|uniref:Helicase C-terminal domain-containing protein n=2 Tax=Anoxybacillus flavithermus TaxID=33934 RepID=A0AAX1ZXG3_9BACL|nr:hypothetical protein EA138_11720 [Anoxybacillus flavithermus]